MSIKLKKTSCKFDKLLYTLIGISTATNIFYLVKLNSFQFGFLPLFSLVALARILINPKKVKCFGNKSINLILLFYFFICCFSSVLVVITGFSEHIDIYLKNIMVLFIGILIYISIVLGKDHKEYIYKGIKYGLAINAIYILYQVISSNNLDAPFITIDEGFIFGGHSILMAMNLYYHGRGFGFFVEPSHAAVFFNTMLILCFFQYGKVKGKFLYFLITISYILTMSSAIPLLFFGWVIMFLMTIWFSKNEKSIRYNLGNKFIGLLSISIFVLVTYIFLNIINIDVIGRLSVNDFASRFATMMSRVSLQDATNSQRLITIIAGLELFGNHPLGIGYGLAAKAMESIIGISSLHSRAVSLMIELGFLGIMYITMSGIIIIKKLIICRTKEALALSVALLVYAINLTLGSGIPFDFFWVVLGLASIVLHECFTIKKAAGEFN